MPLGILHLSQAVFLILVIIKFSSAQSGKNDENRPYEFGFNIEGHQHRHEKKDEKGIIMGEFGFITADGYYHITVYATDENGNFKIIKMKNVYVGLPMDMTTTPLPPVSGVRPSPETVQVVSSPDKEPVKLNGVSGCSGCLIPEKNKEANQFPGKPSPIASPNVEPPKPLPVVDRQTSTGMPSLGENRPSSFPSITTTKSPDLITLVTMGKVDTFTKPPNAFNAIPPPATSSPELNTNYIDFDKPETVPTVEDLTGPLYKFNYTLTYHGHEEEGNRAGDKRGSYFSENDGEAVIVKYIANQFGYQPNITFTRISPEEVKNPPGPNELKGYEFKWFY